LPAVLGLTFAFVAAAVWWFVATATASGDLRVSNAFAGLGYLAAVLGLAVLVVLVSWLFTLVRARARGESPPRRRSRTDDHAIVRTQLVIGAALVALGAIIGLICLCFIHPDDTATSPILALATAVIGAGATLLPAGAAGSANARLAAGQSGATSGPDTAGTPTATVFPTLGTSTATFSGFVQPRGQAGKVRFQYGPTAGETLEPGTTQTTEDVEFTAGATIQITGTPGEVALKPGALYGVRLIGETQDGHQFTSDWVYVRAPSPS